MCAYAERTIHERGVEELRRCDDPRRLVEESED